MPSTGFRAAAHRHYADAAHLLGEARYPNADHLAGFAAECGLKTIMLDTEALVMKDDKPHYLAEDGKPGSRATVHINGLWEQARQSLQGRTAATRYAPRA